MIEADDFPATWASGIMCSGFTFLATHCQAPPGRNEFPVVGEHHFEIALVPAGEFGRPSMPVVMVCSALPE